MFTYDSYCSQLDCLGFTKIYEGIISTRYAIPNTKLIILVYCGLGGKLARRYYGVEKTYGKHLIDNYDFCDWFDLLPEDFKDKVIFNLDLFRGDK